MTAPLTTYDVLNEVIAKLLDPAELWEFDDWTMRHVATGQKIWLANGSGCTDTYPVECKPSWNQRRKLNRAIDTAKANFIHRKLNSTSQTSTFTGKT